MLTDVLVSDPIGRSAMDAPSDATMGSPLLVPFDGSTHAESVLPYLALLADGDREVILLQVVPEAQSVSSPMGDVMLSANEVRRATETAGGAGGRATSCPPTRAGGGGRQGGGGAPPAPAAAMLASVTPSLRIEQLVE